MFDKQVHASEFKLRILVTDGCNYTCKFCLNDFQPKPSARPKFLDKDTCIDAINAYTHTVKDKYPAQVYFSGGEPTLHPRILEMMVYAKYMNCRVTLNTNGSFSDELEKRFLLTIFKADCFHISAYEKCEELAERAVRIGVTNTSIQCVYSNAHPYVDSDFLEFYMKYELPIKIFGNMNEDPKEYEAFAKYITKVYPYYSLSFRFIGVQENRGQGCSGCKNRCVTLKAAWVFPDGGVSFCPQRELGHTVYYPQNFEEWVFAIHCIEEQHRSGGHNG